MAKILYHTGTETYFGLDDDVVVIDLDKCSDDAVRALYDHGDPNGVLTHARHVHSVIEEAD